MSKLWISGVLLTVAGLACGFAGPAGDVVEVGDQVNYKFRTPPVMGMGLTNLSDLRGKPVIVEFWGTK